MPCSVSCRVDETAKGSALERMSRTAVAFPDHGSWRKPFLFFARTHVGCIAGLEPRGVGLLHPIVDAALHAFIRSGGDRVDRLLRPRHRHTYRIPTPAEYRDLPAV